MHVLAQILRRCHAAVLMGTLFLSLTASGATFDRYKTEEEISVYLRNLVSSHPDLFNIETVGTSEMGRPIVLIRTPSGTEGGKKKVYLNATHHGNEQSSTESLLYFLKHLAENKNSRDVHTLLNRYQLFIQPVVNPDGLFLGTRLDADGIDPNRDYSYPGGNEDHAFQSASTRTVVALAKEHQFHAALALHSGTEAILWPWCYKQADTKDQDVFYTISKRMGYMTGIRTFTQSYNDYPSYGEFIDYAYDNFGTLALTFEVSLDHKPSPSKLPKIVERSLVGTLTFLYSIMALDEGILTLEKQPDELTFIGSNDENLADTSSR